MLFLIALIAAVVAFFVYRNAKKRFQKSETTFALMGFIAALLIAFLQFYHNSRRAYRCYRFSGLRK